MGLLRIAQRETHCLAAAVLSVVHRHGCTTLHAPPGGVACASDLHAPRTHPLPSWFPEPIRSSAVQVVSTARATPPENESHAICIAFVAVGVYIHPERELVFCSRGFWVPRARTSPLQLLRSWRSSAGVGGSWPRARITGKEGRILEKLLACAGDRRAAALRSVRDVAGLRAGCRDDHAAADHGPVFDAAGDNGYDAADRYSGDAAGHDVEHASR